MDNSQVQKKKRSCLSCLLNYSQYYQHLILHVAKNPRIFGKKVGERIPTNFKETFIKPFVNVAPKTSKDYTNSAKDIRRRETLNTNACKTNPKCSKFWNAKIFWNIKTSPKCFNILMHSNALIGIQDLEATIARPSRGPPVSLSKGENLHDYKPPVLCCQKVSETSISPCLTTKSSFLQEKYTFGGKAH